MMNKRYPLNLDTARRAANKLKREFLRIPPVRVLQDSAYLQALEAHVIDLPPLDPRDLPILEGLRRDGVHIVPVESLDLPTTKPMLKALDVLVSELRALHPNGNNAPRLPLTRLMEFPEVYLWGLDERLLNLVENHIGLPIRYHGADLRREIADGAWTDVRQWHVDAEDHRMFKVIMYLNDVAPGGGPFNYISRRETVDAVHKLNYGSGFVADDTVASVVPRDRWLEALGKSRSAVFADTCKVFHRAQPPTKVERYSITFSWTSTTPVKTYPTMPLTDEARAAILGKVNARQRSVLPERDS